MSLLQRRTGKAGALACASLLAVGVLAVSSQLAQADNTHGSSAARYLTTSLTAASFANPGVVDQPWVRWPITAAMSDQEIQSELAAMKKANISGAELGQGYYPTQAQLQTILTTATRLGITISLSHGPIAGEGFSINDDNARKKLDYGSAYIAAGATYSGTVPASTTTNRKTLVAVQAFKCLSGCAANSTATLDQSSRVDLTSSVTGKDGAGIGGGTTTGSLSWTAPAGSGQWVLIGFWNVGNATEPDLLTTAGLKVLTDGMAASFAPVKSLLQKNAGDLFYDSHTGDRGSPTDTWSNTMSTDFKAQTGYSIDPYLALLVKRPPVGFGSAPAAFTLSDATTAKKFTNDFDQARTDIWIKNQIVPLQKFAAQYNMQIRLQPYGDNGDAVDSIEAAATTDKTETETLWFGDEVDNYLPEASANHMTGRNWYSIEGSAELNGAYSMTWQDQVIHLNKAFAGGVTKLVYHIYPADYSSTSSWPGYSLFPNSFGNSWGPRSPLWQDAAAYNSYFARNQQVLSQGAAKVDVAVYMQNYTYPQPYSQGNLQYWSDPSLAQAGYTRDYLNPTLLDLPNAVVNHKVLAADGPGYKAFIFDSAQLPTAAASRSTVTVDVAQKMLSFAKAGLPVIIVGAAPSSAPGLSAADDAKVTALVAQLLKQPSTYQVASEADVTTKLAALGITPDAKPATAGPVLSVHRQDAKTDYYWLYNQGTVISPGEPATDFEVANGGSPVSTSFTLQGRGVPYLLNTWNGSITPIENYTTDGKSVTVHVDLANNDTEIVALTTDPGRLGQDKAKSYVVSTTADQVVVGADGRLSVAASKPGMYRTTLSNGRTVTTAIGSSPQALDLTGNGWKLNAEDWMPANPGATGQAAVATTKSPVSVDLPSLTSWPNIPALANSSGTGTYSTTFTLPSDWKSSNVATLNLGAVMDSFTVTVNGRTVPFIDQVSARAEIGRYLHGGSNTLTVDVATTLKNRLRTLDSVIATRPQQQYGLIGPVTITPSASSPLSADR